MLLSAPAVRAEPQRTPLHIELQAPAGCAIAEPIAREVERLLPPTETSSKAPSLKLSIIQEETARFRLIIETGDDEKGRFRRELEASNCRDFIRPTAVIMALAINPRALAALGALPEPGSEIAPGPSEPPSPPATEPTPSKVENPASTPIERDAWVRPTSPAKRHELAPFVRAAQVIDFGALPAAGIGPALGGGFGWHWLRVEASGVYLLARQASLAATPQKGGDIQLITATVVACAMPLRARTELGGCLGSDVGVLRGKGFGVSHPDSGSAAWIAAKAGVVGGYRPSRSFAVMLHVDAVRRIGSAAFELADLGAVHRPASWGMRLDLGLELRFE